MAPDPPPGGGYRPGGSWGWTAPDGGRTSGTPSAPPGGDDSLTRRLFQLVGVLAALLIAVVAFAWLQGGDDVSLNPIAQAAVRTQQAPGAKTAFHATVSGQSLPRPLVMTGAGLFNGQTNRSQMTMTVPTPAGKIEMEAVGSGTQVYLRSKLLQRGLPEGDEWFGFDLGLGISSETAAAANSDPSAQLDQLRAVSDEFETLGKENIRGVETTVYRSTFDFDSYAEYLRGRGSGDAAEQYERLDDTVPSDTEVETWIDGKGLVRRIKMTVDSRDPGSGEQTSMEMTGDFYDFGISPDIQLPDPDSVYDVTPRMRAELGLDG